jgi:hypothetical protein
MFYWFEPVLYLDPVSKFQYPETTESLGYFIGFAENVGDALTLKILKNDLVTVLHRIVVRLAADASHREIEEYHLSQMYKNHSNYQVLSQALFGKIVIIRIDQEGLIMMCQTELGLRQITQTSI